MKTQKLTIAFLAALTFMSLFGVASVEAKGRSRAYRLGDSTPLPPRASRPTKPQTRRGNYEGLRWIYSTQRHNGLRGLNLTRNKRRVYGPGY